MESVTLQNNPPISLGFQIGGDIGQRVDPTAIVLNEKQLRDYTIRPLDDWQTVPDERQRPQGGEVHHVIRYVQRLELNTPYHKVAQRIGEIYRKLDPKKVNTIAVDATGVGTPVCDLIKAAGVPVTPVYITGGKHVNEVDDELHIPKGDLVSQMQVYLQQRLIHLPDNPEARAAADELLNFEIRVTESANLKSGVFKIGEHDDIAVALMLATWESPDRTIKRIYDKGLSDFLYERRNG